jgi:biopolymer transport protein TolQ
MLQIYFLEGNPFFDAYTESDLIGKLIFIGLIALSIISWSILIHKLWMTQKVKKESLSFRKMFFESRLRPLSLSMPAPTNRECPNAFGIVYEVLKGKTLEVMEKNKRAQEEHSKDIIDNPCLLPHDMSLLEAHATSTISSLTKYLEKNLYLLSTIVTLAPFLGLLGTVYGILVTFTGMSAEAQGGTNQVILGGLSLALTTTVIGLIDAIPALIGYNYLKNIIHDFDSEMERFAIDILSSFELQYRKVDIE